jgi:prepilin-type N-terminal cleavage/methylation domain-containing protein/prepilin-type processing-associated H-X9-DG protein
MIFNIWHSRRTAIAKSQFSSGFTLIELIVVIAIIGLLAAILFPVFARAREKARQATCQSNLKQLGLAFQQYIHDNDERYPMTYNCAACVVPCGSAPLPACTVNAPGPYKWWPSMIYPYVGNKEVFKCPSIGAEYNPGRGYPNMNGTSTTLYFAPSDPFYPSWRMNYVINEFVTGTYRGSSPIAKGYTAANEAQLASPSDIFLSWDCLVTWGYYDNFQINADITAYDRLRPGGERVNSNGSESPHSEGENYLYCDGHVKWLPRKATLASDVRFTIH